MQSIAPAPVPQSLQNQVHTTHYPSPHISLTLAPTHQSNSIQSASKAFPLPRNPNLYPHTLPPSNADSLAQEMNAAENGIIIPSHPHSLRPRSPLVLSFLIYESIDAARRPALYPVHLCFAILLLT